MNISQPVASAIKGVHFGFLTSEDVRALSVKRVINPTTFDSLLNPVIGGLYDPAFGVFGDNACSTCNLKVGCAGHCGHIELPVHVYHPSFMDQCLRLLRAKCAYCHKFKMSRTEVGRYICKLRLLSHGLVKESYEVDEIRAGTSKNNGLQTNGIDTDQDSDASDVDAKALHDRRNEFTKRAIKAARRNNTDWTASKYEVLVDERREVVRDFLALIAKIKKCAQCGGVSSAYRKDKFVKIFKKQLNDKDKVAMVQAGLKEQDPLIVLKKQRRVAAAAADKKHSDPVENGTNDVEESEIESEGEGEDIEMLDIEQEVSGGTTLENTTLALENKEKAKVVETYLNAGQVHAALVLLFQCEEKILSLIYGPTNQEMAKAPSADMFFIRDVLIPPTKFRPEAKATNDSIAEAPDNTHYKNILSTCDSMGQIHKEISGTEHIQDGRRRRNYADFQEAWIRLQNDVNSLLDRDRNPLGNGARRVEEGIKQRLEKKEGLFRKNMMGKRVNFAARTVISPDPNIETNEIGVPPVFAIKLTYPEPVTDHNFQELKEAVINGPYLWPGAVAIESENGQVINLQSKNLEERTALANQLQAPSSTSVNGARPKKVHRHLNNGDIVIMNRQPTLHKPSMMCHRARVLPGEKTLRMHYANCNTYNADFDGDEMNLHFPQNELARSEAINIADTDHQYLSATAAKPLRGLIQDHISMGLAITNRDTFFTKEEYQQLLYAAIRPESNHIYNERIEVVPPAIFKPKPLWTGKQVITTIMKNIMPRNYVGLTFSSKSTTAEKLWGAGSEEAQVIFKDGILCTGILDKAQIGPSGGGLINSVYEVYGHVAAGKLLSILGRLLTKLLHMRAFSCGVQDLVFTPQGDKTRKEALSKATSFGLTVATELVSLQHQSPDNNNPELHRRLEEVLRDPTKQQGLDIRMKKAAGEVSSEVTKACLPTALVKPFPKNQMQAMTSSGAKGSGVNANQISCNLGQQVLEGSRVPVMVSGKTLPCFKPFETSARAGGYIVDRFLTGVRPQEYFFHAMAGREGLIDTAVKTSRSGYLQRCLCKGLEGLRVEHDSSVRSSDGSVIQFLYGDDALDVAKAKYTSNFKFIGQNYASFFQGLSVLEEYEKVESEDAQHHNKKAEKSYRRTGDLGCCDPALSQYPPARYAGSMSEKLYKTSRDWMDDNPDKLILDKKKNIGSISKKGFQRLLEMRYLKSVVEAGEAVGVVAGQSVGEPSTQMTLNTFHLAGHAAKNVTLGIPRLREILMTASMNIPTPTMTLYLHEEISEEAGRKFAKGISRLSLSEITDKVTVTENTAKGVAYDHARIYTIEVDFFPTKEYCEEYAINVNDVTYAIEKKFLPDLQAMIRKQMKKNNDKVKLDDARPDIGKSSGTIEQTSGREDAEREGGDDDSGDEGDDDATKDKAKANKNQGGYDAPADDEQDIAERGRRDASPLEDEENYEVGEAGESSQKRKKLVDGVSDGESSDSDSDSDSSSDSSSAPKIKKKSISERIMSSSSTNDITSFSFSPSRSTCTFTMEYPATTTKLLLLALLETSLRSALIQSIPGVKSATYIPADAVQNTPQQILTEGANLVAMREYAHVLDTSLLYTNDIGSILLLYGVEACRATILKEVDAVFKGHAIDVDYRHLSLIADFMTRAGGFRAFSRRGFSGEPSSFMKMSFETTVGFLKEAVLEGGMDELKHPSARGVIGRVAKVGTGAFDVLVPVAPWGGRGASGVLGAGKGDDVEIRVRDDDDDEEGGDEELNGDEMEL